MAVFYTPIMTPERDSVINQETDSEWIMRMNNVLLDFSTTRFNKHGRGAVVIDRNNVLVPPRYISLQQARSEDKFKDMVSFIEKYDPNNGYVLSLVTSGETTDHANYRVDMVDVSSEVEQ